MGGRAERAPVDQLVAHDQQSVRDHTLLDRAGVSPSGQPVLAAPFVLDEQCSIASVVPSVSRERRLGFPSDDRSRSTTDRLSAVTIHNLRASLTVIKAQAQMVERWVRRNDVADADDILDRLQAIDGMVTRLVGDLNELRESPASTDSDAPGSDASRC